MAQRRRPGATSISTTREQTLVTPRALLHPHLRRALRLYKWLFGFIVVGVILTAPVIVLIQDGTRDYWHNLINQIAALWVVIVAYPLLSALVMLVLLLLLALSLRADAESAAEARGAAQQAAAAAGAGAAQHEMATQLPAVAKQVGAAVGEQVATTISPPVQAAAAGGAYAGVWVAIGEAAPRMANAVATEVVGQLQENLAIAVAAGQRARLAAPSLPTGVVNTSGLPRSRQLFGRAPQLESLLQALTSGGAVNVCAVEGLPGIGKTALAAEAVSLAVERHLFTSAIWLSVEGKHGAGGLASVWADLAVLLDEQDIAQMSDVNRQRAALRAALANPDRDPLLIALDNVEPDLPVGYADALAQTLTAPRTSLLLTARQALDSSLVRPFPLDTLNDAAAHDFFCAQLQLRAPERPTRDEAAALPAIIKELDGLALALQLTADYASVQRRPLPALLDQLRREGLTGGPLAKLKASIDRSWAILTPTQRPLFAGLALLDGSSFPRAAALAVAADETDAQRDETGSAALDALVGLSLVEPLTNDRMRLHPRLREYAGERLRGDFDSVKQHALGAAAFAYWLDFADAHP
ncbi:MAG TPA: NB-ARC domain-containing protein, partial [Ktedonobacterales bacterium]